MKLDLNNLRAKMKNASDLISSKLPIAKSAIDTTSQKVQETAELTQQRIKEAVNETRKIIQTTVDHERTQEFVKNARNITEATRSEVTKYADIINELKEPKSSGITDEESPETSIENAIKKLKAKDKVGLAGEGLSAAAGAAAGVAAAGTVASAAGATTLLGSTTLASTLGGIFVTTTPVGWVIGSALIAGAAGFGFAKMVRSGSEQDQIRKKLIDQLNKRLQALQSNTENPDVLIELNQILSIVVFSGLVSEEQVNKMIHLIEQGVLNPEIALKRMKDLAISAGVIESA